MNQTVKSVLIASGLLLTMLLAGCSSSNDGVTNNTVTPNFPDQPLDDAAQEQLNGIWEQRGYGNLYSFENNRTTLFAVTEASCVEITSFDGVAGISPSELELTTFALEGDELSLLIPGNPFTLTLNRLDELPARCDEQVARDAQTTFDYLWNTFDQFYAFFDLRGVDWDAEYAKQSVRIAEVDNDEALFSLLSDLLSPIDDDFVALQSNDQFFSPAMERSITTELREGFEAQSEITDFGQFVDSVLAQLEQTIGSRMDAGSITRQGPLVWATAEEGATGYLFIERMAGFAEDEDATGYENLLAARQAMDQAMTELATTSRMVIDIRINSGGLDAIALDFASRFTDTQQLAFTKTARGRNFESNPVQAYLTPPTTGAYLNPVTLIVGSNTAGAAEVFAIPMHRQPQVTLIGEPTAGALSDRLGKPLPNGWSISLSNEVYLDSEGVSFEQIGLKPETDVAVFKLEAIFAGDDPAVDLALSMP